MVHLVAASHFGQVEPMITMDEHHALEHVCSRLIERFPDLPAATVRLAVREVHARFDGRVRDYVPILVEREARTRLATITAPLL
jgi:hypothetical protein